MRNRMVILVVCFWIVAGLPATAAVHEVQQEGLTFVPSVITVAPGDTVRWIWTSGSHTVTSGEPCTADGRFDAPLNSSNQVFEYVVPGDVGEIPYFCRPHCFMEMVGTIVVETAELVGDLNCDGDVNFGDINPFVLALSDIDAYNAQFPGCPLENRDINGDGEFNFGDINPFVSLLSGL